jgi:hypothetical protein
LQHTLCLLLVSTNLCSPLSWLLQCLEPYTKKTENMNCCLTVVCNLKCHTHCKTSNILVSWQKIKIALNLKKMKC